MYISKFQILNFKSYRDSTEIEFKPGFNIITGKNNAGKTALLEALTLRFGANRSSSRNAKFCDFLMSEATQVLCLQSRVLKSRCSVDQPY